jgi:hypothetical protein
MRKIEIKSGDKYNNLTVLKEVEPKYDNKNSMIRMIECECDCGNKCIVQLSHLRHNNTKSCGCHHKKMASITMTKTLLQHGRNRKGNTKPEYVSWQSMKQRCYNTNKDNFSNYGGRGIKVCDRWKDSFINFFTDMGERLEGYTLDRINNDGNYEPTNCRWATHKEQMNNQRKNIQI